jgi:hypothetical protein
MWYPGGAEGQIEFYQAAPDADYFPLEHVFFPWDFFRFEDNLSDVGELTRGRKRNLFSRQPLLPEDGRSYVGTPADFLGIAGYPGPTTAENRPHCGPQILSVDSFTLTDPVFVPTFAVDSFGLSSLTRYRRFLATSPATFNLEDAALPEYPPAWPPFDIGDLSNVSDGAAIHLGDLSEVTDGIVSEGIGDDDQITDGESLTLFLGDDDEIEDGGELPGGVGSILGDDDQVEDGGELSGGVPGPATGSGSATLSCTLTASGSGDVVVPATATGSGSATLTATLTASGSGDVVVPAPATGSGSATLAATLTASGSGDVVVPATATGSGSATLTATLTASGSGEVVVPATATGSGSATLSCTLTASGSGDVVVPAPATGSGSATLTATLTASGSG